MESRNLDYRLGIIINPTSDEETSWTAHIRKYWRDQTWLKLVIKEDKSKISVESGVDNEDKDGYDMKNKIGDKKKLTRIFTQAIIIGHGGDGTTFFHGVNNFEQFIKAINEQLAMYLKASQTSGLRIQVCSAGTKPTPTSLKALLFVPNGWEKSAPDYLSFIYNGGHIDLPQTIGSYNLDPDDLKQMKRLIEMQHPNNESQQVQNLFSVLIKEEQQQKQFLDKFAQDRFLMIKSLLR